MQNFQPLRDLDENAPNFWLRDQGLGFSVLLDFGEEIAAICILHDNTKLRPSLLQKIGALFDKCLLVRNDIRMVDRSKDAYFVKCILFLFLRQIIHLHFFHRILMVVY